MPHAVTFAIRNGYIEAGVTCSSGEQAPCRWYCTNCEEWSELEVRPDGQGWHWVEGGGERLEFPDRLVNNGSCLWAEWVENEGYEDTYAGGPHAVVDGPIVCWFDGSLHWAYADDPDAGRHVR